MKKFFLLSLFGLFALFVNGQNQRTQQNIEPKLHRSSNQSEEVKVVINVEDVNSTIKSYIDKNYAGYSIVKAGKVEIKGEVKEYKVKIKKDDEIRNLAFDKDFNFLNVFDPKRDKKEKTPRNNK